MSNVKLAKMGWAPTILLDKGLAQTYRWFLEQRD
jgi:hypothetical protein